MKISSGIKNKLASKGLWPIFFVILFLKYSYYGYSYLPIADDNNMYGIFRLNKDIFNQVLMKYKMFTTRPAAAVLDAYFWTKFWDRLGLSLLLMTIILFITSYLLYWVSKKCSFDIGVIVLIIFALTPFGSEATYWLSASTRLVAGMFFTVLSLYIFCIYLEYPGQNTKRYLLLLSFFITNLLSYGFYEQIIVLSFCAVILLFAASWSRIKAKWVVVIPFINFLIIGFWYIIFSSQGNMAARGQIVKQDYWEHFGKVTEAINETWNKNLMDLYYDGFKKGLKIIASDGSYIYLLLTIFLSIALSFIAFKEKTHSIKLNIIKLLIGVFLFIVPFAPFYPMKLIWMSNRNLFPSFIGLGLILEGLANILSRRKLLLFIKSLAVGMLSFVFLVSNVYELNYYRNIGQIDREIISRLSATPGLNDFFHNGKSMILLNTKTSYVSSISNRVENCTGADWALIGAIKAQTGNKDIGYALPIPNESYALPIKKGILDSALIYGIDDNRNIFPLHISKRSEGLVHFSTSDGKEFGSIELLSDETVVFHRSE